MSVCYGVVKDVGGSDTRALPTHTWECTSPTPWLFIPPPTGRLLCSSLPPDPAASGLRSARSPDRKDSQARGVSASWAISLVSFY